MDSDDQNHDHEDHDHAVFVPVTEMFAAHAAHAHDRQHMAVEEFRLAISNFFETLDVEQLLVLRRILAVSDDTRTNGFLDGQIASVLRLVHKVNPDTGNSLELNAEPEPAKE